MGSRSLAPAQSRSSPRGWTSCRGVRPDHNLEWKCKNRPRAFHPGRFPVSLNTRGVQVTRLSSEKRDDYTSTEIISRLVRCEGGAEPVQVSWDRASRKPTAADYIKSLKKKNKQKKTSYNISTSCYKLETFCSPPHPSLTPETEGTICKGAHPSSSPPACSVRC